MNINCTKCRRRSEILISDLCEDCYSEDNQDKKLSKVKIENE